MADLSPNLCPITAQSPCPSPPLGRGAIVGKYPSDCPEPSVFLPVLGGVLVGFVLAIVLAVLGAWLVERPMKGPGLDWQDTLD